MTTTVSTRMPGGTANYCPICDVPVDVEVSESAGDAPCSQCGRLLWWFQNESQTIGSFVESKTALDAETTFLDLGMDSLDVMEFVMETEEEFDISIPDSAYEKINSIKDAVQFVQGQLQHVATDSGDEH